LKSAKLRDEDIHHTEEAMLQMNQLSAEEVAQRRGELRKMRELMFRAEVHARRVGKIKSRTYRRIKRKEKESIGEKINEDDNEDEEGILKRERERAMERATLKRTGKRARQKRQQKDEIAKEDGVVEISSDKVLTLPSAPSDSNPSEPVRKADQKASQQAAVVQADESESDSNSEVGAQEAALTLKGKGKANGIKAFEQRDLVAAAFAGDNVIRVRSCLSVHLLTFVLTGTTRYRTLKRPKVGR
jgi:U3 small nucleolar RNA-associated protein 14